MAQVASEAKVGAGEAEVLADGAGEVIGRSPTQLFWRRFRRDRYAIAGLTFIIILAALALGARGASSPRGWLGGHLHVTGTPWLVLWVVAGARAALGLYRIARHHAGSGVMALLVAAGFALTHYRLAVPSIQPGLTLV